jgi:hypothetical protein
MKLCTGSTAPLLVRDVKPIMKQIDTDRLIDDIIYNLYGLNKEKIEVVKKSAS